MESDIKAGIRPVDLDKIRILTAQTDAEVEELKEIRERRQYIGRGVPRVGYWLEWQEGFSNPVRYPEKFFRQPLQPFEPFRFPGVFGADDSPSIPRCTFIGDDWFDDEDITEHRRRYTKILVRSEDGSAQGAEDHHQPAPSQLVWLIAERDALKEQLNRCAERLQSQPTDGTASIYGSVMNALKVWIVEQAISIFGEPDVSKGDSAWEQIRSWSDLEKAERNNYHGAIEWAEAVWHRACTGVASAHDAHSGFIDSFSNFGGPRSVAKATAAAVLYSLRKRDFILGAAGIIAPRWYAAESVVYARISDIRINEDWIEDRRMSDQKLRERDNRPDWVVLAEPSTTTDKWGPLIPHLDYALATLTDASRVGVLRRFVEVCKVDPEAAAHLRRFDIEVEDEIEMPMHPTTVSKLKKRALEHRGRRLRHQVLGG